MSLNRFMKENVKDHPPIEYVASERILGDDGKPEKWKLRPLTNKEVDIMKDLHTSKVRTKSGQVVEDFDADGYMEDFVLSSLIYPSKQELEDKDLQDSWGAYAPIDVLKVMLNPGELADLKTAVSKLSGYEEERLDEKVKEAKKLDEGDLDFKIAHLCWQDHHMDPERFIELSMPAKALSSPAIK